MPTRFKNIKTTRGRGYDEKLINRLNDSLLAFPIKQRASILGTFIEESGGDPLAKSENGTYQGLAQWGSDRYRITSDNPEVELKNQLDTLRSTINNTTDGKSWTHGGEGSGYSSLMDAYNDFNNPNLPIDDVFRAFSFGYVRPKGKDESYENRLKVVKQVYDELLREEETNNTLLKNPEIIHTEPRDAIAASYRPEIKSTYNQNIRALNAIDVKKALYRLDKKLRWENQPESPHFVPEGGIDYAAHSNGGKLDTRKWDELSLSEKSEMIGVAVRNGVTNLKDIRQKYNEFAEGGDTNFWIDTGLSLAKTFGLDKKYKGKPENFRYKQNLYSIIDPTTGFPQTVEGAIDFKLAADAARNPKNSFKYARKYRDDTADAGWAKRLGLPYDKNLLIDNPDGSVRLSEAIEAEIPTDTLFLENRIKANEELLYRYRKNNAASSERVKLINDGIRADKQALDALKSTYKTGKPVVINEDANNSRRWIIDSVPSWKPSPLNILHNYTIQYDKDKNAMNYYDLYDFNEFEDFVPGNPYIIKGSIKLKK